MTTAFAFVTPAAFYPVMRGGTAYRTGYSDFIAFALKVITTIFFAAKTGAETENIHSVFFAKINIFYQLWVIADMQK
jgi:hypothetical protein